MASKIAKQSDAVAAMSDSWDLIDDLVGGTAAMRKAGKKYLPQFPKESDDAYRSRLRSAVCFPAFSRTSATLAAKPLSRPIGLKELSPSIEKLLGNIDRCGTPLQAFSASLMRGALRYGLDGVLVDAPVKSPSIITVADEQKSGFRPYLAHYPAMSIIGWKTDGAALTNLRLMEHIVVDDADQGEKTIKQVRELEIGKWTTWREVKNGSSGYPDWAVHEEGAMSLDVIPFVFFYGIQEGFGIGKPPLLDLAHMNVEHWQSASDQQNILHVARVPILFAKGFGANDEIVIGASTAAKTDNEDAELKYVEHSGAAISAGRQSLLDLEDRMRQAGAELLTQRPAVTTATQVRSDDEGNRSILQEIAEQFEDSMERCLQLMTLYTGEKDTKPEVELFKDFGSANLGEKGGDLLLRAANDGRVSSQTVFEELKRLDVLAAERTWEDEQQRLAQQTTKPAAGDIINAR
jgi:hypothetical protein